MEINNRKVGQLQIFLVPLILLCCFILCNAQNYQDSLKERLEKSSDKSKLNILKEASLHFQVTKPDTAIILAQEVLNYARLNNDSLNELEAFVLLGRAYQNRSEFYKSTQYLYKALKLAEKWKLPRKLASFHNSIGISFYYLQDYNKAIFHLQRAAELKLQFKEMVEYGTIMGNLAGTLHQLGRNKEALASLKLAESNLDSKKYRALFGNFYNTYGSIYQMGFHKLDSAEYFYRKALSMTEEDVEGISQIAAHTNIGLVCRLQSKFEEAEFHLRQALKISLKLNRAIATVAIYESLSNLFEQKNDFKNAFIFRTKQVELRDSIFKSDKEKVVADIEAQYQNEKGKQIIQAQKLALEQNRNKMLWVAIILILLVLLVFVMLVYFSFQKKLQRQLEQAKETFFSNVVHEIRSPITMIQGPIKVIQKKVNDQEIINQLNFAEKNLHRLNDLLNQMLLIAKVDTDKIQINENFGNFFEFIEPIISQYQGQAKIKKQKLIFNHQFTSYYFSFDADAFQKIIENLLSNAIKYTPENGEIGIEINLHGGFLNIEVWDNGLGIDEDEKEKIFTRFYRSKESLKNGIKGIGIGLFLVKSLVEAMKGIIEVRSEKGQGSVFTLKIPVTIQQEIGSNMGVNNEKSILIIEDDHDIATFNKELLESHNYNVEVAHNGLKALDIINKVLPDLIVSDLMMPEMDGKDFLTALRKNEITEHIPVIMLSAKSSAQTRLDLLKAGAQAYLAKPFLPDELVHLVANQLLLQKQKSEKFKEVAENQEIKTEEKYKGNDPYTEKFFKILFANLDNSEFTVEQFADLMATNRSHFQRKIKSLTGFSPSELIKRVRLDKSKDYFKQKKGNITEIAYLCGFSSQSYFTKSFTQYFGLTPSQFLQDLPSEI
ncbi:MAG TPA: response regulator [Bacteroidia bacterium]|nr:response regulator [Bacteroidia bacterium]